MCVEETGEDMLELTFIYMMWYKQLWTRKDHKVMFTLSTGTTVWFKAFKNSYIIKVHYESVVYRWSITVMLNVFNCV